MADIGFALRALLTLLMLVGTCISSIGESAQEQTPIIAEIFADPSRYSTRATSIYGLVIELTSRDEFLLQDISQHPLRVRVTSGQSVSVGDQVSILGVVETDHGEPVFKATMVLPTKVLGGGGCC